MSEGEPLDECCAAVPKLLGRTQRGGVLVDWIVRCRAVLGGAVERPQDGHSTCLQLALACVRGGAHSRAGLRDGWARRCGLTPAV